MRIVIAMMKHETNTFSPIVTDWARFEAWGAHTGEAVQAAYGATPHARRRLHGARPRTEERRSSPRSRRRRCPPGRCARMPTSGWRD